MIASPLSAHHSAQGTNRYTSDEHPHPHIHLTRTLDKQKDESEPRRGGWPDRDDRGRQGGRGMAYLARNLAKRFEFG